MSDDTGTALDRDRLAAASGPALTALGGASWTDEAYLAGSAALALHLGHRPARDLDFMSSTHRLQSADRRDLLTELLALDPATRVETARDGFLYARLGGGVAVRVYYYPYPLVDPVEVLAGIEVASLVDLGLMKLGAIISRGSRRDFVDLFHLCRRVPLAELLARSPDKFGHVRDFPLQALKGLADLGRIEGEPMPELHRPLDWSTIEAWAANEVRTLGRHELGLP